MLENPFKPITPEEDTDPAANANLVGKFLGPEAQAAYEKLDQGREEKKADMREDLKLTDAEKNVVKEAHEKWDRKHYIEWAASFGKDEEWVDKTFTFHDDGSVECENPSFDDVTELVEFPPDLVVKGYLFLDSLESADGLVFPHSLKTLSLDSLESVDGLALPDSLEGLYLESLQSAEGLVLPDTLKVLVADSLQSADGLILPNALETLLLDSLESVKDLVFPQSLTELRLNFLQSTEGLVLPKSLIKLYINESLYSEMEELLQEGKISSTLEIHYT